MKRIAALLLLTLAGCSLRPLYSGGGAGPVAQGLHAVQLAPIPGRAGWLVRTALEDKMAPGGSASRYRLEVDLDDQIIGFGLRRTDDGITRQRRTLRARYRLVDASLGTVVLDATAGSDASVDVVSSEYATVAAEQTALEHLAQEVANQIVARVALYISRTSGTAKAGAGAGS
jgi:LPS-assembly lipoprotein